MLEKFKKYFPGTTAGVETIKQSGSPLPSLPKEMPEISKMFPSAVSGIKGAIAEPIPSFKKPSFQMPSLKKYVPGIKEGVKRTLTFPKIDIPENIKKDLKTTFKGVKEQIVMGSGGTPTQRVERRVREFLGTPKKPTKLVSAEGGALAPPAREAFGAIPFIQGTGKFAKYYNRRQARQYEAGYNTYDFFPEMFYMSPSKYKMIGAPPNFPEIHGSYRPLKVGKGWEKQTYIPKGLKGDNFGHWSHTANSALMTMDEEELMELKLKRMRYWKGKMETEENPYWKARARWNYHNVKYRALKNYRNPIPEEEQNEWAAEWARWKHAGGYPMSAWYALTGGS